MSKTARSLHDILQNNCPSNYLKKSVGLNQFTEHLETVISQICNFISHTQFILCPLFIFISVKGLCMLDLNSLAKYLNYEALWRHYSRFPIKKGKKECFYSQTQILHKHGNFTHVGKVIKGTQYVFVPLIEYSITEI